VPLEKVRLTTPLTRLPGIEVTALAGVEENVTVPPGVAPDPEPVTVAVSVTFWPTVTVLADTARVVVVLVLGAALTVTLPLLVDGNDMSDGATVTLCEPAVLNVTVKVLTPLSPATKV